MRQTCPTTTGLFFLHRNEIAGLEAQNASCSRPMLNQRRFTWVTVAGVEPPFASVSSGWDASSAGRHAAQGAPTSSNRHTTVEAAPRGCWSCPGLRPRRGRRGGDEHGQQGQGLPPASPRRAVPLHRRYLFPARCTDCRARRDEVHLPERVFRGHAERLAGYGSPHDDRGGQDGVHGGERGGG